MQHHIRLHPFLQVAPSKSPNKEKPTTPAYRVVRLSFPLEPHHINSKFDAIVKQQTTFKEPYKKIQRAGEHKCNAMHLRCFHYMFEFFSCVVVDFFLRCSNFFPSALKPQRRTKLKLLHFLFQIRHILLPACQLVHQLLAGWLLLLGFPLFLLQYLLWLMVAACINAFLDGDMCVICFHLVYCTT